MQVRKRHSQAFTLVEILIVVVILGILAAIVIPQFTSASESAKASSLVSQVQTIRSQLELYQVQHNGNYPTLSSNWDDLTTESGNYGPYLQQPPSNPLSPVDDATDVASDASAAWYYDSGNGNIKAVIDMSLSDAKNLGLVDESTNNKKAGDTSAHEDVVFASGGGGSN